MSDYYELSSVENIQILHLKNLLSEYANKEVLQVAKAKVKEGHNQFLVDLANVSYMNSVGINLLIQISKLADGAGGKMVVVNPSQNILHLLNITKLMPILNVYDSFDEGIGELK